MSVPCSVVTVRGGTHAGAALRIWSREIGGGRVRHGVVRVHDVEPLLLARRATIVFVSASRYCGSRNSGYDGTSTRSNDKPGQPSRQRNGGSLLMRCTSMPASRERVRQLGGDDAAAADRGVTDDADVHEPCFRSDRRADRLADDEAFGERHAGQRAELRVAALDRAGGTSAPSAASPPRPASAGANWLR